MLVEQHKAIARPIQSLTVLSTLTRNTPADVLDSSKQDPGLFSTHGTNPCTNSSLPGIDNSRGAWETDPTAAYAMPGAGAGLYRLYRSFRCVKR